MRNTRQTFDENLARSSEREIVFFGRKCRYRIGEGGYLLVWVMCYYRGRNYDRCYFYFCISTSLRAMIGDVYGKLGFSLFKMVKTQFYTRFCLSQPSRLTLLHIASSVQLKLS